MRAMLLSVIATLLVWSGIALAADPMSEKEALPTLKERVTKDAIKGTPTAISVSRAGCAITG